MMLMKALDNIRTRCKNIVSSTRNEDIEAELMAAGQSICEEAFSTKATKNDTNNQHDAFFWALYFKGTLINSGFAGPKKATRPAKGSKKRGTIWGRDNAEALIKSAEGIYPEGYALIVSNAIYYSVIHESENRRIISQEFSRLEALEDKYKGELVIGAL